MTASLVTGGSGFIGSHLVSALAARGESVRVLDIAEPVTLPDGVQFVQGSILDPDTVEWALDGIDRLYHLAAVSHLWIGDKRTYDRVNRLGTEIVMAAAERRQLDRIVHCSSEVVLIGRRYAGLIDEAAAPGPDDMAGPYCRSKFLAERCALSAAARGAPVIVVNPTAPIGPGDHGGTAPTAMLRLFLKGGPRLILDCVLNLVDVRDVALGHILAADHGRPGQRYILGGADIRLMDLAARLDRLAGRTPQRRFPVPGGLALAAAHVDEWLSDHITRRPPTAPLTGVKLALAGGGLDSRKAMRELGYRPRPLDTALKDAVAWLSDTSFMPNRPPAR